MREFASTQSRLIHLSWEVKVVYSAFLLFCLFAYIVIGALVWARTGMASEVYVNYYVGNEPQEIYGKSPAELLEVTHFHLFSYPIFLLIQGHIFLLTSWPRKLKAWIVVLSFVGAALYLAAPWLVVYVSPTWVLAKTLGRLLLVATLGLFLVVPLHEMWLGKAAPRAPTTREKR